MDVEDDLLLILPKSCPKELIQLYCDDDDDDVVVVVVAGGGAIPIAMPMWIPCPDVGVGELKLELPDPLPVAVAPTILFKNFIMCLSSNSFAN